MNNKSERESPYDNESIEHARVGLEELRQIRDEVDGAIELTEKFIDGEVGIKDIREYDENTRYLRRI